MVEAGAFFSLPSRPDELRTFFIFQELEWSLEPFMDIIPPFLRPLMGRKELFSIPPPLALIFEIVNFLVLELQRVGERFILLSAWNLATTYTLSFSGVKLSSRRGFKTWDRISKDATCHSDSPPQFLAKE